MTTLHQNIIIYTTPDGNVSVDTLLQGENIWLNQKQIAELFGVDRTVITKHLKNIFETDELDEKVACAIFAHTTQHGAIKGKTQSQSVNFYNLDAIISVGYRVNSKQATQFRIWATRTLKEYVIKGFVMDDDRLKNGEYFGKDYFKELLERVRSIRTSERRIYQQITDIFAECTIDYNKTSDIAKNFYAMMQNKFHFAITGQTAAEIVYEKSDQTKPHMGLQTWKNSPQGRVIKSDVSIAKNYLPEEKIKKLERAVSGYFDYIERLIEDQTSFTMDQLAKSVNEFLQFNRYEILDGKGKISHKKAEQKAFAEYKEFNKTQKIESDFDREMKRVLKSENI